MQTLLDAVKPYSSYLIILGIGFIAGLLARAILPGKQRMGIILTIVLGVAGAYVGFFLATFFGLPVKDELVWLIGCSTGGALILLALLCVFGVFRKK